MKTEPENMKGSVVIRPGLWLAALSFVVNGFILLSDPLHFSGDWCFIIFFTAFPSIILVNTFVFLRHIMNPPIIFLLFTTVLYFLIGAIPGAIIWICTRRGQRRWKNWDVGIFLISLILIIAITIVMAIANAKMAAQRAKPVPPSSNEWPAPPMPPAPAQK